MKTKKCLRYKDTIRWKDLLAKWRPKQEDHKFKARLGHIVKILISPTKNLVTKSNVGIQCNSPQNSHDIIHKK